MDLIKVQCSIDKIENDKFCALKSLVAQKLLGYFFAVEIHRLHVQASSFQNPYWRFSIEYVPHQNKVSISDHFFKGIHKFPEILKKLIANEVDTNIVSIRFVNEIHPINYPFYRRYHNINDNHIFISTHNRTETLFDNQKLTEILNGNFQDYLMVLDNKSLWSIMNTN